ncbi:MAG: hypothetical protein WCG98_07565 [bacterium]
METKTGNEVRYKVQVDEEERMDINESKPADALEKVANLVGIHKECIGKLVTNYAPSYIYFGVKKGACLELFENIIALKDTEIASMKTIEQYTNIIAA